MGGRREQHARGVQQVVSDASSVVPWEDVALTWSGISSGSDPPCVKHCLALLLPGQRGTMHADGLDGSTRRGHIPKFRYYPLDPP